tara:strand:- start:700 stop:1536 length:837 start_codon:yes stop_codon:yes gene_type:complete
MNHKILEQFLDEETCATLIDEANKYSTGSHIKVQNNRLILPSSSLAFLSLIEKSNSWKKLHDKLNSKDFLNTLTDALNIKNHEFVVTNFFFNTRPNNLLKKYKEINSKKLSTVGNVNLIFYFFFKIYRFLFRKIKFSLTKKKFVELLYDYSISPNGYFREIHRDSDSRTIVFLIYLNELNSEGKGGDLQLYKYSKENNKIPSQPNSEDCELIKSIPPKTGRLVTFLNSHESLHSVAKMENYIGLRHFLYGSFTLLSKKNDFIKKGSKGSLKTNFNIFE